MVAAFSLDISVFLSLPCTFEVYLCCWSFLEGGLEQEEAHFIDICQIQGWWPSRTNTPGYLFALLPITRPFPTLSFPSDVLLLENGAQAQCKGSSFRPHIYVSVNFSYNIMFKKLKILYTGDTFWFLIIYINEMVSNSSLDYK